MISVTADKRFYNLVNSKIRQVFFCGPKCCIQFPSQYRLTKVIKDKDVYIILIHFYWKSYYELTDDEIKIVEES